VERTETGWGRAAETPPRWRSLLDRALLGRGAPEDEYDGRFSEERRGEARAARGYPDGGYDEYSRRGYEQYPEREEYPARDDYTRRGEAPAREAYPARGEYPARDEYAGRDDYDAYAPRNGYAPAREDYDEYQDYPRSPARPTNGYPTTMEWQPAPATMPAQAAVRTAEPTDEYVEVLRQELSGPQVLAFANPKGGVHKTTATVLAAATIGSVRGKGVLAWDDNELRGTLGLRAGSARHARTIRHLVRDLAQVEATSGYDLRTRLDDYLRHASDASYDVLAGEENPRFAQRLDPYTVKRVLDLLRRTHDVICVDTGNNVESPNWQTVLQAANQLVVTTVPREDAAFTADWMLDLLDEAGMEEMVASAVTLLSCPSPNPTPLIEDLAAHFAGRTRSVVVVPYDPALESGSQIEYSDLQPATRAAWLRAAAVMMDPYAR
jgi:MinD-like ATPase involved in chromosome partitioning or flagellar assembly